MVKLNEPWYRWTGWCFSIWIRIERGVDKYSYALHRVFRTDTPTIRISEPCDYGGRMRIDRITSQLDFHNISILEI